MSRGQSGWKSRGRMMAEWLKTDGMVKAEKLDLPSNIATTDDIVSLPIGVLLPYIGLLADIPTGWHICDGTNGTPDLTDSFVMGGSQGQNGQTGGNNSVTPQGSVSASLSGSVSVNNHTLSTSQMPSHNHSMTGRAYSNSRNSNNSYGQYNYISNNLNTGSKGSSGAHNHGASHNLSVNSSLSLSSQDNKPKYYKSAYIMRVS